MQAGLALPLVLAALLNTVEDRRRNRAFFTGMTVLMVLTVLMVARAAAVMALSPGGLPVPLPIHTMHWLTQRMPDNVARFYATIYLPTHCRIASFVAGASVAFLEARKLRPSWLRPTSARVALLLAVFAASLLPRLTSHGHDSTYPAWFSVPWLALSRPVFGCSVALLVHWCDEAEVAAGPALLRAVSGFLRLPLWFPVATLSYAGYLVHVIVIGGLAIASYSERPLTTPLVLLHSAVGFALSLAVAALLHHGLEKRLLALRASVVKDPEGAKRKAQ
jgi:peptidoglycan/LPS O-acetylase OafA/YrhL